MSKRLLSLLPFLLIVILTALLAGFLWESQVLEQRFIRRIGRETELSTKIAAVAIRDLLRNQSEEVIPGFVSDQLTPLLDTSTRITVLREDGRVLADSWENPATMSNHADRQEFVAIQKIMDENKSDQTSHLLPCISFQRYSVTTHQNMLYCITGFETQRGLYFVRTAVSVQSIEQMTNKIRRDITVLTVLAMFLAIGLGYLLFYWLSQPLTVLSDAALKIASGSSDTKLPQLRGHSLRQIASIIADLSVQLQTQMLQLSQEKKVRDSIFDTLVEGVILIDREGVILEINRAAASILDSREDQARKKMITSIWRNPEVELFFNELFLRTKPFSEYQKKEFNFVTNTKNVTLTVDPLILETQKEAFLLVLYDLTRMKKLENYRRDFIANLSHEIKTPLTVISGIVEALQEGVINDPSKRETFLQTLSLHAERLNRLLEDVLSLANLECHPENQTFIKEHFPLAETVQIAIALCKPRADSRQMTLTFVDKTENRCIALNPSLLEQAVVNLLDNAIKYSISGDTINVILEPDKDESGLRLVVEDHGRGIPLEHRARVFERFYRVDSSRDRQLGGTGLGLAIVKHIAQLHGGGVSVEPTIPTGSRFIIHLKDQ
ncbi:MAG: sensor histidine kinase [Thermoguttaceae bacterium]